VQVDCIHMNKTEVKKAVKGLFNCSRKIGCVNVCNVAWLNTPYMVIENDENFEDARKDNFAPIELYKTQGELINAIYKVLKN